MLRRIGIKMGMSILILGPSYGFSRLCSLTIGNVSICKSVSSEIFSDTEDCGEKEPKAARTAANGENGIEFVFREEGGAFENVLSCGFVTSVQKHGVGHAARYARLGACETVFHALWQALDDSLRPNIDWHG